MKRKVSYFLLLFSLAAFIYSSRIYIKITPFNTNSVTSYIKVLTSENLKGRLPGTIENTEAAEYIKTEFAKSKLNPLSRDYFESFNVNCPQALSSKPYLRVTDKKGNLIKEYTYGSDYREDMLNFKANNFKFNKNDSVFLSSDSISLNKNQNYFLLYTPESHSFTFRSSFVESSPYSLCIILSKNVLSEIKEYVLNEYSIECFIPYVIKNKTVYNVAGIIKGKNPSKPPIVLSSHFDHLGVDLNNNIYSGALDNASGTAFMLELSKYISSLGTPERTIIFVSFNAEEFNCLGSKEFVEKHKTLLTGGKVYNFDMIGSNNPVSLCIMGGKDDSPQNSFLKAVATACEKQKIDYSYLFEDASDHSYFRKANIDAVTLSDKDTSRIHTTEDKLCYIDTKSIERCYKLMNKEIIKNAFNNNLAYLYYSPFMAASGTTVIATIFFIIRLSKYKK